MERDAAGWARVTVPAPPGIRYRYRIDGDTLVPDPASRFQPEDVHGPSEVIDPMAYRWGDEGWRGIPAERLVFYELHVGTFTPEGTFAAARARLDHLGRPRGDCGGADAGGRLPGARGWGYDGVLLFAPESAYGRPEELKALVDACHARGLAVILDVVYNHFGPEGNYLRRYAPFASPRHRTPWGEAVNFDGPGAAVVREFVVHNALYWLEEYHLDGLRLDAVHAIRDDSPEHILMTLGRAVAAGPSAVRLIHLVLENDANEARWLTPTPGTRPPYRAQWNDDVHHVLHVLLTGERGGYYADYQAAAAGLARALAEGFVYQGEWSTYRRRPRGSGAPGFPTAFVSFLQNHDQVGNRAMGERISALAAPAALRAATVVLLLAPALPLIFMGQEWAAPEPFLFFSDLGPDLGPAVSEGRRREFERFPEFADPAARARIPDPQSPDTTPARCSTGAGGMRPVIASGSACTGCSSPCASARSRPSWPARRRPSRAGEPSATRASTWSGGSPGPRPAPGGEPGPVAGRPSRSRPGVGPLLHATGLGGDGWEALPPWCAAYYLAGEPSR